MNKHFIFLSAIAVLLFSCTRESDQEVIQPGETITFTAGCADSEDTRTILQVDGTSVWWETGAQVNVFFSNKASGKFTSTNSQAQDIVDFQGSLTIVVGSVETENPPHAYWAVYPYDAANTCDGESVTLTVPSSQTAVEGTFANKMFPSIATSTNFYLAFYNVCGGVRFTVANEGIASVSFKANNGESLAGKVQVGFDGVPVVKSVVEGASEVVVNAPEGGFVPGKYYFAALLPQTLSRGVSLEFKKSDGRVASTSLDNSITINRSRFGKMEGKDEGLVFMDDGSGPNPSDIIVFADMAAKYACVAKYDTNGDGEVSIEEAEAATSFSGLFDNWKGVVSFNEINYFKNVHSLNGVFNGCNKLVSITIPESINNLGTNAFNGCSALTSVVLPPSITALGDYTFNECSSLVSVDIPSNVTSIGNYTFHSCYSLESVSIPSNVTSIGQYAFYNCSSLGSIDLPSQLKTIGQHAFQSCISLTQVVIPNDVTSIPQSCFQNCTSLTSVSISSGVTSVGDNAFYGVNMWKLDLPSNVSYLGRTCFGNITCIILPSTSPVSIQSNTFNNVSGIFVPSTLIDMYRLMTYWAEYASMLHPLDTYKEKNEFVFATSGTVDMGTSVKWSAYNLGATTPKHYGDYYAWGEPEAKSSFSVGTYMWCNGESNKLTKYCPADKAGYWDGEGMPDGKTVLEPEDDAAHVNLGGKWRMPTDAEWTELRESCLWEWTIYEGINGRMVYCVENGNSLFLPAAGYRSNIPYYVGGYGYYWSSSLDTDSPNGARIVFFRSDHVGWGNGNRYDGYSVRPVYAE